MGKVLASVPYNPLRLPDSRHAQLSLHNSIILPRIPFHSLPSPQCGLQKEGNQL